MKEQLKIFKFYYSKKLFLLDEVCYHCDGAGWVRQVNILRIYRKVFIVSFIFVVVVVVFIASVKQTHWNKEAKCSNSQLGSRSRGPQISAIDWCVIMIKFISNSLFQLLLFFTIYSFLFVIHPNYCVCFILFSFHDVDIRDLISIDDVMEELDYGPNGALIYCMEYRFLIVFLFLFLFKRYLLENIDWFSEQLGDYDNDYILIDCPGLKSIEFLLLIECNNSFQGKLNCILMFPWLHLSSTSWKGKDILYIIQI